MFRTLTIVACILASVSGQSGNQQCTNMTAAGCASPMPSPCPYGVAGCMNQTPPPPSRSVPPSPFPSSTPIQRKSPDQSSSPVQTLSPSSSYSPDPSPTPVERKSPDQTPSPSTDQRTSPDPSPSPSPDPSPTPVERKSPDPSPSPVERKSPDQSVSPRPSSPPSPPPSLSPRISRSPQPTKPRRDIYSAVTFQNIDPVRVTNQTLQGIQSSLSCALNVPSANLLLQNVSYTDTTGMHTIPFNATEVNQKNVTCTGTGRRQLQTTTTNMMVYYLIVNSDINATELSTILSSSPYITGITQGLQAVPSSTVASNTPSDSVIMAFSIPLGIIAFIGVAAVVMQVALYRQRQASTPIRAKPIIYITESPLSVSKEVTVQSDDEERISHNPTRVRI